MRLGALLLLVCSASAQRWEIGAAAGYGIYRNVSVYAPAGKAQAGIRDRFIAGAVVGEDLYEHVGGEFRYTYQDGDPFLSARGTQVNIQGQSHAFHYDLLVYTQPREARLRPYVAVGLGAKLFVASGPAPVVQPLADIATLTTHDEVKFLVTGGGGVKLRLRPHLLLRVDFRDYITPFPKKLISPAAGGTARGILHQFTPMAGLSATF